MFKIKIKDKVLVLKGKDKGKIGIVSKVVKKIDKKNGSLKLYYILEGINFLKKHTKALPNKNKPGGILKIESPISSSNLILLNPITGERDKISFKFLDNGKKVRILKSNGEVLN